MQNDNMIRFFVSSTFEDMQDERDAIQMRVLPALARIAANHGQNIDFRDLRWGINTQDSDGQAKSERVLKVCFEEIKKCRPYMIVMLGERYGSAPSEDILDTVLSHMNNRDGEIVYSKDDVINRSYTELEILYGPLSDDETLSRTLFLFREPIDGAPPRFKCDSDAGRENMERLKSLLRQRLRERFGNEDKILTYSMSWKDDETGGHVAGIEEFSKKLEEKLTEMIMPSFKAWSALAESEKKLRRQMAFAEEHAKNFSAVRQLELCEKKGDSGVRNLYICGGDGSGKTTLMAKLALTLSQKGEAVFPVFEGADREVASVDAIHRFWADCVRDLLVSKGISVGDDEMGLNRLLGLYSAQPSLPRLVLMAELYSELYEDGFIWSELVSKTYPNVLFVYTLAANGSDDYGENAYVSTHENLPTTEETLDAILHAIGKELPSEVRAVILEKHSNKRAAYIAMLVKRLVMIDGSDLREAAEHALGDNKLLWLEKELVLNAPEEEDEFPLHLLDEAAQRLGDRFISVLLNYVAMFPYGIRRRDLAKLIQSDGIEWDSVAYSVLINYFSEMITETADGYTVYTGRRIREIISRGRDATQKERLLFRYFKIGDLPIYYRKIFEYLKSNATAKDDEFFTKNIIEFCYKLDEKEYILALCEGSEGELTAKCLAGEALELGLDEREWFYSIFAEKGKPYTKEDLRFLSEYIYEKRESGKFARKWLVRLMELSVRAAKDAARDYLEFAMVYYRLGSALSFGEFYGNSIEWYMEASKLFEAKEKASFLVGVYDKVATLKLDLAHSASFCRKAEEAENALSWCVENKAFILHAGKLDTAAQKAHFLYRLADEIDNYDHHLRENCEEEAPEILSSEAHLALLTEALDMLCENDISCSEKWVCDLLRRVLSAVNNEERPKEVRLSACKKAMAICEGMAEKNRKLYGKYCLAYAALILSDDPVSAKKYMEKCLDVYEQFELDAEQTYSDEEVIYSLCELMMESGLYKSAWEISQRLIRTLKRRDENEDASSHIAREMLLRAYRLSQKAAMMMGNYRYAWKSARALAEHSLLVKMEHEVYEYDWREFYKFWYDFCADLPVIFEKTTDAYGCDLLFAVRKMGYVLNPASSEYTKLCLESAKAISKYCDRRRDHAMAVLSRFPETMYNGWVSAETVLLKWEALALYVELALEENCSFKKEYAFLKKGLLQVKKWCPEEYQRCLKTYRRLAKTIFDI